MNILMGLLAIIVSESGLQGTHVHIASSMILMKGIKNLRLNHMFMAENGTSLYLTGKNYIYHLDTESHLNGIDEVKTGPNGVGNGENKIDDVTNIVIPYGTDEVITCGSSYTFCHKRLLRNISDWTEGFERSINNSAAVAFVTDFENETYLFVGCPHGNLQPNTLCDRFGISWFKHLFTMKEGPEFKTSDGLLLITETYVKAFAIGHHRLFFSIQRNKTDNSTISRVANICQKYTHYAPHTYVDMELKCGNSIYMQAVEKTCFEGECIIVATFTNGGHSVVCAYLFSEIKSSLAVNVKRCHDKTLQLPTGVYDYFNHPKNRPCTGPPAYLRGINTTDDFFLCNEEGYSGFQDVIGDTALRMNVSVRLNHTVVTALTLVSIHGRVLALLGTAKGEIIKALVFPREEATVFPWKAVVDIGHAVMADMFVYGYTLYAFSENVVKGINLTDCSEFSTCDKCMASKDFLCGWCILENRCTTTAQCSNSEWIMAEGSVGHCPYIHQIIPNMIRTDESQVFTLILSHNLSIGLELSCKFESLVDNKTILMKSTVPRIERSDELSVWCRSPEWTNIEHFIKGAANVSVLLFTNVSSVPVMRGDISVFKCETFTRCRNCSFSRWTCKWCPLQGRCIKENNSCNRYEYSEEIDKEKECPRVETYTVSAPNVLNSHGDAHLSIEESYNITVKGVNFIDTHGLANYQCSVKHLYLPGGEIQFPATRISNLEIMCHIRKQNKTGGILWNLDSATSLHLDLQSKQLDGQSFKVVFYHCGSLIYPSNNCGQCESFKYFQPYLRCHWCSGQCIYSGKNCTSPETVCPDPVITKVYPLSAHINAITPITVEGYNLGSHTNETLNAVSVGNIPCYTIYTDVVEDISTQITCNLGPSQRVATEHVTVNIPGHEPVVFANYRFTFQIPRLIRISPNYGPLSGGTNVTIYGEYLDTGWERKIMIGEQLCRLVTVPAFMKPTMAECRTVKLNSTSKTTATVSMVFDNQAVEGVNFTYLPDPVVWDIQPRKSFESGGRVLTVIGLNLFSVHTQKLRAHTIDGKAAVEMSCGLGKAHGRVDSEFNGSLTCRSPMFPSRGSRRRINQSLEVLGIMEVSLVMDDVSSVRNLPSNISLLLYYPDPTFYKFTETQRYAQVLFIRGKHLDLAATAEDVQVLIGCEKCNVTTLQHDLVICNPRTSAPKCNVTRQTLFAIKVSIGFLIQEVGHMEYKNSSKEHQVYINIQITGGVVVGGLFLIFVLSVIGFCVKTMKKLREQIQQEESSKEYELELLKASE